MAFSKFGNRALPIFEPAACSVGGCDRLADDDLRVGTVRKNKGPLTSDLMPALTSEKGDASLDGRLIEVAHEVLSNGSGRDLEAASGEDGAKCGAVTMKIAVRDRILVNDAIVIFPPQQSRPAMALRISD